ncbi:MAG TPA: ribonuclease HII [Clostridia bacterium]|jgi:ribonuclease HII|nr:ribonuclease HII [Clostridia bacterium]
MNTNVLYDNEKKYISRNRIKLVCGVDEAGRGPLAGPVAACACIPGEFFIADINDSKKISEKKREELYNQLIAGVICHKTIFIYPNEIDATNILMATKKAMQEAVSFLFPVPDRVLVDAVKLNLPLPTESIIKGDATYYSIACASIIAKVERDKLMYEYAKLYPEYGFDSHKGYGTKHHIEMIKKYGPCEIHRKSFITNILG